MTAPPGQSCGNCVAYKAGSPNAGWCCFYPPTVIMTMPVGSTPYGNPQPFRPEVMNYDWCAQWKKIPPSETG